MSDLSIAPLVVRAEGTVRSLFDVVRIQLLPNAVGIQNPNGTPIIFSGPYRPCEKFPHTVVACSRGNQGAIDCLATFHDLSIAAEAFDHATDVYVRVTTRGIPVSTPRLFELASGQQYHIDFMPFAQRDQRKLAEIEGTTAVPQTRMSRVISLDDSAPRSLADM